MPNGTSGTWSAWCSTGTTSCSPTPAAGVPARALMVFRVEDSWGPPDNRTQWIKDVTQPLLARRGAR